MKRFTSEELVAIRNELPIRWIIESFLRIHAKESEGIFRFVCPKCGEMQTAVNPKTNLSRCFLCEKNFNTLEIVMEDRRIDFVHSVKLLQVELGALSKVQLVPDKVRSES
jgi:hypothetical protein